MLSAAGWDRRGGARGGWVGRRSASGRRRPSGAGAEGAQFKSNSPSLGTQTWDTDAFACFKQTSSPLNPFAHHVSIPHPLRWAARVPCREGHLWRPPGPRRPLLWSSDSAVSTTIPLPRRQTPIRCIRVPRRRPQAQSRTQAIIWPGKSGAGPAQIGQSGKQPKSVDNLMADLLLRLWLLFGLQFGPEL